MRTLGRKKQMRTSLMSLLIDFTSGRAQNNEPKYQTAALFIVLLASIYHRELEDLCKYSANKVANLAVSDELLFAGAHPGARDTHRRLI
jgi:hypothetical protein